MQNLRTNKKEGVYYWPLWLSKSLSAEEQIKIKKILKKVQSAQVYLWKAFNIYDDFLDNEGKISELPKANDYFRLYLKIHYQLNLAPDYYKLLEKTFNDLSIANKKELTQKKLTIINDSIFIPKKLPKINDLTVLADKSLVLALGPIALLSFLGYKIKSRKVQSTLKFFRFSLAAKQLADDSKDWLDDLKEGFLTTLTIKILKVVKETRTSLNLKNDLGSIYLLFADTIASKIIYDLRLLCSQAEDSLFKNGIGEEVVIINKLIKPILSACQKAEKFRNLVLEK